MVDKYVFELSVSNGAERFIAHCREVICKRINEKRNTYDGLYTVGCIAMDRELSISEAYGLKSLFNMFYGDHIISDVSLEWEGRTGLFITVNSNLTDVPSGSFYSFFLYLLYNAECLDYILKFVSSNSYKVFYKKGEELSKFIIELANIVLRNTDVDTVSTVDRVRMSYYTFKLKNNKVKNFAEDGDLIHVMPLTGFSERGAYLMSTDGDNKSNDMGEFIKQFKDQGMVNSDYYIKAYLANTKG